MKTILEKEVIFMTNLEWIRTLSAKDLALIMDYEIALAIHDLLIEKERKGADDE